jgi:hypothetical protein
MSTISSQMNIPKTISVGFQKRDDTYTKMLAYVIYTDAKGVLRKENSWNSWRDKKIKAEEFKNEPTSGFVLNKKVGGYKSDWNMRSAYIRIYDPRGFEFEITVENLLFILQETSAIKGKGLDGEFVYAWHGKDLVLLPVDSAEYKACSDFTSKQSQKVGKKEMVEGFTYLMKDMTNVMYLGRHDYIEFGWRKNISKPMHIFLTLDTKEPSYIVQSGFTKLAEQTSTSVSSDFADAYDNFKKSSYYGKITGVKLKNAKFKFNKDNLRWGNSSCGSFLLEETDGSFKKIQINKETKYNSEKNEYELIGFYYYQSEIFIPKLNEKNDCDIPNVKGEWDYWDRKPKKLVSLEEIEKLNLKKIYLVSLLI